MKKTYLIFSLLTVFLFSANYTLAETLSERVKGSILLQVESKGEAWYVNPTDNKRYSLGRPADAYEVMRQKGIGITNNDLKKIPVAVLSLTGTDQDGDQLSDMLETAVGTNPMMADSDNDTFSDHAELSGGYNPIGAGKTMTDATFSSKQKGKIFLQVESKGEAWYVNPKNSKRYFLGRAEDAFNVMRQLGVGITTANLNTIPTGSVPTPAPTPTPTSNVVLTEVCSAVATFFTELVVNLNAASDNELQGICVGQYGNLSEPLRTLKVSVLCPYTLVKAENQEEKQQMYNETYTECLADDEIGISESELAVCKTHATVKKDELKNTPCDDSNLESYEACFNEVKGQQLGLTAADLSLWQEFQNYNANLVYAYELVNCLMPEEVDE